MVDEDMVDEDMVDENMDGLGEALRSEERTWGMLAHLAALSGYVTAIGFVVGPLVVWLLKKDESAFVDDQGKESLNFQITMFVFVAIGIVLAFVLIGFVLLFAIGILQLVFVIIAMIKANEGVRYRYPINFRFIR